MPSKRPYMLLSGGVSASWMHYLIVFLLLVIGGMAIAILTLAGINKKEVDETEHQNRVIIRAIDALAAEEAMEVILDCPTPQCKELVFPLVVNASDESRCYNILKPLQCTGEYAINGNCMTVYGGNVTVCGNGNTITSDGHHAIFVASGDQSILSLSRTNMETPRQSQDLTNFGVLATNGATTILRGIHTRNLCWAVSSDDGYLDGEYITVLGQQVAFNHNNSFSVGQILGVTGQSIYPTRLRHIHVDFAPDYTLTDPVTSFGINSDQGHNATTHALDACNTFDWEDIWARASVAIDIHCAKEGTGRNIYGETNTAGGAAMYIGIRPTALAPTNAILKDVELVIPDALGGNYGADGLSTESTGDVKIDGLYVHGPTGSCPVYTCGAPFSTALLHFEPENRPLFGPPVVLSMTLTDVNLDTDEPGGAAIIYEPNGFIATIIGLPRPFTYITIDDAVVTIGPNGIGAFVQNGAQNTVLTDARFNGPCFYGAYLENNTINSEISDSVISNACIGVFGHAGAYGTLIDNLFRTDDIPFVIPVTITETGSTLSGVGAHDCSSPPALPLTITTLFPDSLSARSDSDPPTRFFHPPVVGA